MTKNIATLESLLSELTQERDELEGAIETMIADMAEAPEAQRKSGDWAPDGAMTLRYLQTLNEIAAEQNSTIVFPLPIDLISLFQKRA